MNKISNFENFDVNEAIVVAGFGQTGIQQFGLGGGRPESGYSMTPVVGVVESCSNHLAEQANMYETNDNDDHTAESYLKEAKKHVNESIDKAYENYGSMDEAMVQVAGKDKPSGAKVLATVIVDHLIDKKIVTRAYKKKLESEIQELIINSTF
jgi:hypothetical protein|tara:strand:+ start:121 stop:579 length:459 start_codon:yes stop_codon:yes gene_type:complete